MKFRKSAHLPTGEPLAIEAPRRRSRWAALRRLALLLVLACTAVIVVVISESWIRGDGIVIGELTAVNPISQMRVKSVLVECLESVREGQLLARLENEVTMEAVRQQLDQFAIEVDQAQSAVEIAAKQAEAAWRLYEARIAVRDQLQSVLDAQTRLMDDRYIASLAWQKSRADVARAEAEAEAARFVHETKLEDRRRAAIRVVLIEQRIESLRSSPELMGTHDVRAPKGGFLTQCDARAGEVVDASSALFRIFDPDDAYGVVFLDPADAARHDIGDPLRIGVDGIDGMLTAGISGFYPQFSGLPETLTRYFWQQDKWSQFAPVRLTFSGLDERQRARLRASAWISVSSWELPTAGFSGEVSRLLRLREAIAASCSLLAAIASRGASADWLPGVGDCATPAATRGASR